MRVCTFILFFQSLKAKSHHAVVNGFKEKISVGKFTCGGTLDAPSKILLNYLQATGEWNVAMFQGLRDIQPLVASSGKGNATVIGSYGLDPKTFTTSFQLCDTDILGDIRLLLAPDAPSIRAKLYKMNISTAPSGCFKAHMDTPHGGNIFGSLVVCLPSHFTGGALVTRHNGQQISYDWSSPASDVPAQNIQWAAFYSDIEHEIRPVMEGHRVTLSYILYAVPAVN